MQVTRLENHGLALCTLVGFHSVRVYERRVLTVLPPHLVCVILLFLQRHLVILVHSKIEQQHSDKKRQQHTMYKKPHPHEEWRGIIPNWAVRFVPEHDFTPIFADHNHQRCKKTYFKALEVGIGVGAGFVSPELLDVGVVFLVAASADEVHHHQGAHRKHKNDEDEQIHDGGPSLEYLPQDITHCFILVCHAEHLEYS